MSRQIMDLEITSPGAALELRTVKNKDARDRAAVWPRICAAGNAMSGTVYGGPNMEQTAEHRINPSEEVIRLGQLSVHFLVTADDSLGSVAAFELVVEGRARLMAPAHSHEHYEETIYGVDGVLTWTVDGKLIALHAGQALCIPRGAVHRFDNLADEDAKALCVITPAAIGPQYFRECAEVLARASGGPPDKAKIIDIMRRHGLTPSIATPAR